MFPSSFLGCIISGIKIEHIIVERVFCDCNCNNKDVQTVNEWVYHIGVCESKDKYYLCCDGNFESLLFSAKMDDEIGYDLDDIKELSFDEAKEIIEYLQVLGADNKGKSVPHFSKITRMIMNSVPCHFLFEPCDTYRGKYCKEINSIIVANNQSQISMLFALFHEVTHFLCHSGACSPRGLFQYWSDKEENICNATAFILLDFFLNSPFGMTTYLWDQNPKDIIEIHVIDNIKRIEEYDQEIRELIKKRSVSNPLSVELEGYVSLAYCMRNDLMPRVFYYVLRMMKQMAKVKLSEPIPDIPQSDLYCIPLFEKHLHFITETILPKMINNEQEEDE